MYYDIVSAKGVVEEIVRRVYHEESRPETKRREIPP